MSRARSRVLLGLFAGGAVCGTAHADRPEFGAFINLDQIAESQLHGPGSDDVTYTEVSGTLTARISNRRIVASGTYHLSYRIPEMGGIDKSFNQDGLMRLQANVIDEWLTLETGALITRSRVDASGAAPQFNIGNPQNLTQTYSAFVQPTIMHRIGDLGLGLSYRYAYTQNATSQDNVPVNGPIDDRFDSSKGQQVTLDIGMDPGNLPFGWKVSSEYRHENTTNLAQHFRALNVIGEVRVPLASVPIALVASGGYERTRTSERSPLLDPVTGLPVRGKGGRFVVDPASARQLTYEVEGLIANAGVIWRPSRRTRMEARVGRRYGDLSVTGLIEMRPSERSGLTLIVTDRVESFGQGVSNGLAGAPPTLDVNQIDPSSSYQQCLFGKTSGSGKCIASSLGQASANSYRERAANIIFTRTMRTWTFSGGLGYARRTYIDNPNSPFSLDGVVDQSFFSSLSIGRPLSRTSGVSFSFTGNLFKNGQVGASDVMSGSFSTNYYQSFGRGIQMQASVSVDGSKQDGMTTDVSGRARLGLQYRF
ncbi:hypothetical protein HY78_04005 [Rhizorhabdus wittichii DC-6]|uniref:Glycine-rich cell wall structural protein n=1 Tax=Rhizorhabdus wittichii (strain DSM 6014 / CCUG 31198 / JCM 15750 / NBRC 105917 / EY 4224 / RW1) TaxID=392499 RepID=A0A9J9HEV1_RHIWR|nr:hypothetical protein [Rhizorhabdus wittichii]ABQ70378.1 hypothetical protein Swit_4034 [Rhizorhabdus wittichii RW1]ARR52668.1 hypothetical protein HY78_04005 [Rhizorhabdus wittichii DC-6]